MRSLPIALAAAAVAATVSLACGQDEEAVPPDATAAPTAVAASPTPTVKGQLWRWVNVTVVIPEGSDVYPVRTYYAADVNPPDGGPVLELYNDAGGEGSSLLIDAESGSIIRDNIRDEHRAEIETVLKMLSVRPLDTATAPWPYNGEPPPNLTREKAGDISFLRPSPETGLDVSTGIGFPGGGVLVEITNGRSMLVTYVDTGTGQLVQDSGQVLAADRDVFERWAASVKLCGRDTATAATRSLPPPAPGPCPGCACGTP